MQQSLPDPTQTWHRHAVANSLVTRPIRAVLGAPATPGYVRVATWQALQRLASMRHQATRCEAVVYGQGCALRKQSGIRKRMANTPTELQYLGRWCPKPQDQCDRLPCGARPVAARESESLLPEERTAAVPFYQRRFRHHHHGDATRNTRRMGSDLGDCGHELDSVHGVLPRARQGMCGGQYRVNAAINIQRIVC